MDPFYGLRVKAANEDSVSTKLVALPEKRPQRVLSPMINKGFLYQFQPKPGFFDPHTDFDILCHIGMYKTSDPLVNLSGKTHVIPPCLVFCGIFHFPRIPP